MPAGKKPPPRPVARLSASLVQKHVEKCKKKKRECTLCTWASAAWNTDERRKWMKIALMSNRHPRVGCTACCRARTGGPWASFDIQPRKIRYQHVCRHEKAKAHVAAMSKKTALLFSPPEKEFADCLRHMRQGSSARQGGQSSDKKTRMRWSLSEAVLDRAREFLKGSATIALLRDERKGRLLVRWRACSASLTVRAGVLGFCNAEPTAESLTMATETIIKTFCQPGHSKPRGSTLLKQAYDEESERAIRQGTSVLVTDAAAAEVLASDQLRGHRQPAGAAPAGAILPCVKVVGRDAAHASTRLLKKPFNAHPEINEVLQEYIHGTDSFIQKVGHSPLLLQWWAEAVQNKDDGDVGEGDPKSTSISAAKHRFGSFLNPLSKVCRNLPAVLSLCHKIAVWRTTGTDSSGTGWAVQLLQSLSAGKILILGMAADAAATVNDFNRYADQEDMDIALLNQRACAFVHQIRAQFIGQQVFELPTFTRTIGPSGFCTWVLGFGSWGHLIVEFKV